MPTDLLVDYDAHLESGRVWEVEVEVPTDFEVIHIKTHVISPNRDLAQYIVASIYPNYESISISDEALST